MTWPLIMTAPLLESPYSFGLLADFRVKRATNTTGNVTSGADVVWDGIERDNGMSLTGSPTTFTAPAGASVGLFTFAARSATVDDTNYYELQIRKNGTTFARCPYHDAYYTTGFVSAWVDLVPGDDISFVINGSGSDLGQNTQASGRFYG